MQEEKKNVCECAAEYLAWTEQDKAPEVDLAADWRAEEEKRKKNSGVGKMMKDNHTKALFIGPQNVSLIHGHLIDFP